MNNLKISTKITLQITCVITVCIALLHVIANRSMTSMMKKSELDNMSASLNAQTSIIKQYIDSQETLLSVFGEAPEIHSLLKDPKNLHS